jgi:hypothetical protein
MRVRTLSVWTALAAVGLIQAACGCCGDSAPYSSTVAPQGALADFRVPDVNQTSPTYNTLVSPRDHLGQISAWYFGHAT